MDFENIQTLTEQSLMNVYKKQPVAFDYGRGSKLYGTDGKEYTDFLAGIAVNALGYGDAEVTAAVAEQAAKFTHVSNLFYCEAQAVFLRELLSLAPFPKAFLCNSGAEANEAAVKLARKYFYDRGENRTEIVTLTDSFHGRTLMTATLTGQNKYSRPYAPLPPGVRHVDMEGLPEEGAALTEALASALTPHTAAVLIEVIQGESGVNDMPFPVAKELQRLCRERGILLMIDEIQTGVGRTGTFFAYEQYGLQPDVVTLAKALGGGLPLGAMLAKEPYASAFHPGDHGTTFGGNPVAAAAGSVVLRRLKNGLLDTVRDTAEYFRGEALETLTAATDAIVSVRGRGLMLGLRLKEEIDGGVVVARMLERGFILNCAGHNTLRLTPPLVIKKTEIDPMIAALAEVLQEVSHEHQ